MARTYDPVGTLVAALFIALGVVLILETRTMTPLGSVFPIAISSAMIVCAVVLIVRNVVLGVRGAVKAPAGEAGSTVRRVLLVAILAAWVALLPVLGFFAASTLGYFATMTIATYERVGLGQLALLLVIGLGILGGFTFLMGDVLNIPLPRGILF